MNTEQKLTPKYWVFHNTMTDDIYIQTLSKSYANTEMAVSIFLPNLYNEFINGEASYRIDLIEVNLVKCK